MIYHVFFADSFELTFSFLQHAVDESVPIDQFPGFFTDAKLNFAENILCGQDQDVAIISMNERTIDSPEKYTWGQMRRLVARYAEILRRQGMEKGDYMVCTSSKPPPVAHFRRD